MTEVISELQRVITNVEQISLLCVPMSPNKSTNFPPPIDQMENNVYNRKPLYALALALALTSALSAHATLRTSPSNNPGDDTNIEIAVQALLDTRPELGAPNSIRAQSINHVVYLSGLVDTSQEKWIAESIASRTPGVAGVVNSIEQSN